MAFIMKGDKTKLVLLLGEGRQLPHKLLTQ